MYPKYTVDIKLLNTSTAPKWLQFIDELLCFSGSWFWLAFPLYEKISGKRLNSSERTSIVIYKKESILDRRLAVYEEKIPADTPHHLLSRTKYHIEKDIENGKIETDLQAYLTGKEKIF